MPAVAVIRKRLVLFIRIRFKGYLDGLNVKYSINPKWYFKTRVIYKRTELAEER